MCIRASIALRADKEALTEAYGQFKQEAQNLNPDYEPQTVNTDGWSATQKAWQALFVTSIIIECFLHAFLKIRDCCKKRWSSVWPDIQQQVWDIYQATDAQDFRQQTTDFLAWARDTVSGTALESIEKLCAKTDKFVLAFDFPQAYRTSNMVDRHMEPMARWLSDALSFTVISTPLSFKPGLGLCFIISGLIVPELKSVNTPSRPLTNLMVESIITTGSTIC